MGAAMRGALPKMKKNENIFDFFYMLETGEMGAIYGPGRLSGTPDGYQVLFSPVNNEPAAPEMPQIEMLPKTTNASFRKCYQS